MNTVRRIALSSLVLVTACAGAAPAASQVAGQGISGTIQIEKKLTKRSVTAAVSVYQRGPVVELGKDAKEDPLVYERSHVVVYLEGAESMAAPASPLRMQQLNRRFSPDMLVVPAGSAVSFPNMDPIFHNIFSLSKPKTFDLGTYDKGQTRTVVFSHAGVVYVYCHLHPNMEGTVFVVPNHWYARPDAQGHFRIPAVPPGRYTVVAWHKAAGYFRRTITVESGRDASVSFFIPLSAEPPTTASAMTDMRGMDTR